MSVSQEQKKLEIAAIVIRIILAVAFIVVFIILVYKNCYPAGRLLIDYKIGHFRPLFISPLEPEYRVSELINLNQREAQILISNPVYFNVRTVLPFKKAKISLVYRNINNYQLRVGGLVNPDLWQFDLKELQGVPEKEGWFFGSAEFDLSGYYRVDNQYRFLLSLPYTELTEVKDGLAISAIKLELIRDPLNFKSFWVKLFNKLRL